MKKLILLSLLIISGNVVIAMDNKAFHLVKVKLPDANVLQQELRSEGLEHLCKNTKIISWLADKEKHPVAVAMDVESALSSYTKNAKDPITDEQMGILKSDILRVILKDYPEALEELSQLGHYESK